MITWLKFSLRTRPVIISTRLFDQLLDIITFTYSEQVMKLNDVSAVMRFSNIHAALSPRRYIQIPCHDDVKDVIMTSYLQLTNEHQRQSEPQAERHNLNYSCLRHNLPSPFSLPDWPVPVWTYCYSGTGMGWRGLYLDMKQAKMHWKLILKSPSFVLFHDNLTQVESNSDIPGLPITALPDYGQNG